MSSLRPAVDRDTWLAAHKGVTVHAEDTWDIARATGLPDPCRICDSCGSAFVVYAVSRDLERAGLADPTPETLTLYGGGGSDGRNLCERCEDACGRTG